MKGFKYLFFLILVFNAQFQVFSQKKHTHESCYICKDGIHNNKNPYRLSFKNELPFLIAGAGAVGFGQWMQAINSTHPFTEEELNNLNREDVNAFDRPATYNWNTKALDASDILRNGVLLLPVIFLANHHTRSDFGSLLIMGLEVSAVSYGLTTAIKNITNRTRPYVYNEEVSFDERTNGVSRRSFFSGHVSFTASMSFYMAKVMNDYHPNMKKGLKIALWSFSAAIPAATGYLRVKGGKHFPTDVIVGYAVGASVGWLIPELHRKKEGTKNLSISPLYQYGSTGIYLTYKF